MTTPFGNIAARRRNARAKIRPAIVCGKGEDEMTRYRPRFRAAMPLVAAAGCLLTFAVPPSASAQDADYLAQLKACRSIEDEDDRLACYDAKVGAIVSASDAGDVRVVSREDVRLTRRQLFGTGAPELAILKSDGKDEVVTDLLETTITSARQLSGNSWRFTTAENAVWEISNPPRRIAPINPGDKVVFKKASLGYYFVRINGQMGVKGKRIQ